MRIDVTDRRVHRSLHCLCTRSPRRLLSEGQAVLLQRTKTGQCMLFRFYSKVNLFSSFTLKWMFCRPFPLRVCMRVVRALLERSEKHSAPPVHWYRHAWGASPRQSLPINDMQCKSNERQSKKNYLNVGSWKLITCQPFSFAQFSLEKIQMESDIWSQV